MQTVVSQTRMEGLQWALISTRQNNVAACLQTQTYKNNTMVGGKSQLKNNK